MKLDYPRGMKFFTRLIRRQHEIWFLSRVYTCSNSSFFSQLISLNCVVFYVQKKTVEIIKKCKQTIGLVSFALSVDIQQIHAKLTISIRIGIVCVSQCDAHTKSICACLFHTALHTLSLNIFVNSRLPKNFELTLALTLATCFTDKFFLQQQYNQIVHKFISVGECAQ